MNSDIGDDPAPTLSISAFETITFITSAVLSGHIIITGSGPFSTSLTITFSFLFLSTAVMIVGAIWTIARRRASTDGLTASASATAIRSYTEGGIVGILAAGGSFLVSLSLPGGLVSGALTTSAVFIFLYCTVLIGTSALCGRQSAGKAQWAPSGGDSFDTSYLSPTFPCSGR